MGHYMLLEKTRSRPNEKHPKMTLWEYYSQGGPGDRVQRWYKEYAGVKRPYTWFTQEDAGNPTKNCINRAMTLNCKDSSTYRSTSSTVNTGHTIADMGASHPCLGPRSGPLGRRPKPGAAGEFF